MNKVKFSQIHFDKPRLSFFDVETHLKHFALITFYVDKNVIRKLVDPRFDLVTIKDPCGRERCLFSVVPFLDDRFHFKFLPFLNFNFGQTNYRTYVIDKKTGEHVVWFLGTTLDSLSCLIPNYIWKIPWHRGKILFDCEFDDNENKYSSYKCNTTDGWARNSFELEDTGQEVEELKGFSDFETGLAILTHPFKGYFYRRDGSLGTYKIWHDILKLNIGRLKQGRFELLEKENIWNGKMEDIHSVLIQKKTYFSIYLPPKKI